jgi:hypothetical protein
MEMWYTFVTFPLPDVGRFHDRLQSISAVGDNVSLAGIFMRRA